MSWKILILAKNLKVKKLKRENLDGSSSLDITVLPTPPAPETLQGKRFWLAKALGLAAAVTFIPSEDVAAEEKVTTPEELAIAESVLGQILLINYKLKDL